MRREIKTVGGQLLGYYRTDSSGRERIYTRGGRELGLYDPQADVTKLRGGRIVARGDVTASLLEDES
jgi:hypothetical protein